MNDIISKAIQLKIKNDLQLKNITNQIKPKYIQENLLTHLDKDYANGNNKGINSPITSIWFDLSGKNNNGTLQNFGYISGSGWTNDGLVFDGSDDNILLPNLSLNASFSIEMWLIPMLDESSGFGGLIGYDSTHRILLKTTGQLIAQFGEDHNANCRINKNEITQIVYVYDSIVNKSYFYVNGEYDSAFTPTTHPVLTSACNIGIAGTQKFHGTIKTVRIYNKVLIKGEIEENYKYQLYTDIKNTDMSNLYMEKAASGVINFYRKGSNQYSNRYIKIPFIHVVNSSINLDVWRPIYSYDVARVGENNFQTMRLGRYFIQDGEWACALSEVGASDFVGGFHGYEVKTSTTLIIDGIEHDLTTAESIVFSNAKFTQVSSIYRYGSTTDIIAYRRVEYEFSNLGLKFTQNIEWLQSVILDKAYLCMLPIMRTIDTSGEQITDRAYTDYDNIVDDVFLSGFTGGVNTPHHNITKINIFGSNSGISVEVTSIPLSTNLINSNAYVSNLSTYNKIYFDFCGSHTTTVGEIWNNQAIYDIDIQK